jgi:hypothetical protein
LPPFGKRWFRVFRELDHGHPVAHLRLQWIFLNIREDRRLDVERRKDEVEYGGFFANPDIYAKIKGMDVEAKKKNAYGFETDETEYLRKKNNAMMGKTDVKPRRADVAEMVKRKREEMPKRRQKEYQPVDELDNAVDGDNLDSDDLIVEG